jgi:hypothetical protein
VACLLVLATVAVSCGDGPEAGTAARDVGPPVLEDAMSGPGTDLRDGLRVPPGSRLIGRVFDGQAVSDPTAVPAGDRWTALLLVDEDPGRALETLVADTELAGYSVSVPSLPCFRPGDGAGLDRPQPARCSLLFDRPDVSISVEAAFGACGDGPPASHIRLSARRYPSGSATGPPMTAPAPSDPPSVGEPRPSTTTSAVPPSSAVPPATVPAPPAAGVATASTPSTAAAPSTIPPKPAPPATVRPGPDVEPGTTGTTTVTTSSVPHGTSEPSPVVEPEVPGSWPALPETGDLLNPRSTDGSSGFAPVALLDGTVAAAPSLVDCYASHSSVLRVDGDPADVVDAYAEQFAERSREPLAVHHWDVGTARVTNVAADQAGGDKWYLTVTEEPGEPTWALLETATDA